MAKRNSARERRRRWDLLSAATWNVRSLVESEGPIETAAVTGRVSDDKKIFEVVRHLKRLNVDVAGIQETHWFGQSIYEVDNAIVLTSGRRVPDDGQSSRRGEGVAVILNGMALRAWRNGGGQFTAVNSRLMVVRLKFDLAGGRSDWISIICAYAPTFSSPRDVKDKFLNSLQKCLENVAPSEKFILLADFNARVGSRTVYDDWAAVRGPHGLGETNSSGEDLLNFLSMNGAWICNTWFAKKSDVKWTWQHPRTKALHCIDYIVTRQADRCRCQDVQVIRSAMCGSDHRLLAMRFRVGRVRFRRQVRRRPCRYDVSRLSKVVSVADEQRRTGKDEYQEQLAGLLRIPTDTSCEEQWNVMRSALTEAAETTLGRGRRRQVDWYVEARDTIEPLLEVRNSAHRRWIAGGRRDADYAEYRTARRVARNAVRDAKNRWFTSLAEKIEKARFNSAQVWSCIRSIQQARSGLPSRASVAVLDENGNLCASAVDQGQRWSRHFSKVLNIQSTYDPEILDSLEQ